MTGKDKIHELKKCQKHKKMGKIKKLAIWHIVNTRGVIH